MTNMDAILAEIRSMPGLTDRQLLERTNINPYQQVNQICKKLQHRGLVERRLGADGLLRNYPMAESRELRSQPSATDDGRSADTQALSPVGTLSMVAPAADRSDALRRIRTYLAEATRDHHRYRSWEHCYLLFRQLMPTPNSQPDQASLNLAFYLASWGMYRGSSFLLQYDYTAHKPVIEVLSDSVYRELWTEDLGARSDQLRLVPLILRLADSLREAYEPIARGADSGGATDTLLTKVILGTIGCLPACDQLFVRGFKGDGFAYSSLNRAFIDRLFHFCQVNLATLQAAQVEVLKERNVRYPLMKLVDMHFWQAGFDLSRKEGSQYD